MTGKSMAAILGLVALMVGWPATQAAAHEEGVLKVASRQFAPGDSLRIVGEKFGGRNELRLLLVGAAGRIELATVKTDSAGAFTTTLRVPDDARLGTYRLVAVASDGDEVAALDVALTARPAAAESDDAGTVERPTAEPLELERAGSPLVTGGAVVVAGLALILGVTLLRRSGRTA